MQGIDIVPLIDVREERLPVYEQAKVWRTEGIAAMTSHDKGAADLRSSESAI
jgi:hypothetical protein